MKITFTLPQLLRKDSKYSTWLKWQCIQFIKFSCVALEGILAAMALDFLPALRFLLLSSSMHLLKTFLLSDINLFCFISTSFTVCMNFLSQNLFFVSVFGRGPMTCTFTNVFMTMPDILRGLNTDWWCISPLGLALLWKMLLPSWNPVFWETSL